MYKINFSFFKLTVLILFVGISVSKAQIIPRNHSLTIQPAFGSHMLNDKDGFFHDKMYGFDIIYLRDIRNNKDSWIKRTNATAYGVSIIMRDLNNFDGTLDTSNNSFGQAYGVAGTAQFQLLKVGNVEIKFSPSVGLSYLTKTYFSNPKNRLIGSKINMTLKAEIGAEMPINSKLSFGAGVSTLHFSNGGFTIPNGGLNTAGVFGSLIFKNLGDTASKKSSYLPLQKNSFELEAGVGRRGVYETHKGIFRSGIYAGYNYRLNDLVTLKTGIDAVYYGTVYNPKQNLATFQYYGSSYDKWRTGISLGADLNLGRIAVNAKAGKYIHYDRLYPKINWYWAFGPTYFVTPRVGIHVKTYMHLAQADFQNWGLVVKI